MDLGLNDAQQILKRNAREFLLEVCPTAHVRQMEEDELGFDPGIWRRVCEIGWAGLLIPEQYGGSGGDAADMVVLFEEIGRALLPSPLFTSGVLSALMILAAGSDEQRRSLLPSIASGGQIVTFALTESSGSYEPRGIKTKATRTAAGWTLAGTKLYVPYANAADQLIVAARTGGGTGPDGVTLFIVDPKSPGAKLTILDTIAQDHQYEVVLDGAEVSSDRVLGTVDGAWPAIQSALDTAAVIIAGEAIGAADRCLELTVDYSKRRVQFGRPIGAFQSLQYRMARMVTQVTGVQLLVYEAAHRLSRGLDARLEVSMSKAAASDAYMSCAIECCHIFGGNGFIKESDPQLFFRRAKTNEVTLGDPRWHRDRVAALLEQFPAPAAH